MSKLFAIILSEVDGSDCNEFVEPVFYFLGFAKLNAVHYCTYRVRKDDILMAQGHEWSKKAGEART